MNTRDPAKFTPDLEWRETIHILINASSLRYPDLAKRLRISRRLIESWGKGENLEAATLKHYTKILVFFIQKRFPTSEGGKESWAQVARFLDSPEHDREPHIYVFDKDVLCNRAYLISRMKAVGLTRAGAAELLGTSVKYIRWATDASKEPGEMIYIPMAGYRRILETYGKAWYAY